MREASRIITALMVDAEAAAVHKGKGKRTPLILGPVGDEADFDFKAMARREEQLQQVGGRKAGGAAAAGRGRGGGDCGPVPPHTVTPAPLRDLTLLIL